MKQRRRVDDQGNEHIQQWADADYPVAYSNEDDIRARLQAALADNVTFLNSGKPSTAAAQASQAFDQVTRLTKETNGLIKLFLNLLDDTTGT